MLINLSKWLKRKRKFIFFKIFKVFKVLQQKVWRICPFLANVSKKRKRKLIFLEIFKASSLNFSSFHGILAKSLKNKPFFLKKLKTEVKNTRFPSQNSSNLQGFYTPNRIQHSCKAFIAFLCDNIWHFQAKLAQKSFFLVKNLQIYKVFTPPTGYSTAARLLLRFYVTILGIFKPNKPKKVFFQSEIFRFTWFLHPQPDLQQLKGFYCVFM